VAVLESQMLDVRDTLHQINGKLDAVLIQTTRTNGRVDRLERDVLENFDADGERDKLIKELEKGNAKLFLIVGAAASLISTVLPIAINQLL